MVTDAVAVAAEAESGRMMFPRRRTEAVID
jgi:hypothetical protein